VILFSARCTKFPDKLDLFPPASLIVTQVDTNHVIIPSTLTFSSRRRPSNPPPVKFARVFDLPRSNKRIAAEDRKPREEERGAKRGWERDERNVRGNRRERYEVDGGERRREEGLPSKYRSTEDNARARGEERRPHSFTLIGFIRLLCFY